MCRSGYCERCCTSGKVKITVSSCLLPQQANQALIAGDIIAYPTEAVWGLGCNPFNESAVLNLLKLKHRAVEKGLILVAANWQQLAPYIKSDILQAVQAQSFDRPTTWLLPFKENTLPGWLVGQHSTVAVRVSQHATVKALCLAFEGPLVSTSANPAGAQAAKEIFQIKRYFSPHLAICQGRIGQQLRPSQIIDYASGQQLRN